MITYTSPGKFRYLGQTFIRSCITENRLWKIMPVCSVQRLGNCTHGTCVHINVRSERNSGTMNSSSTGRMNHVQYHKLGIDGDQVEAAPDATLGVTSSSSIGGADEVFDLRPFRSSGYKCFGCIPMRAGIMLLSLENVLDAARKFRFLARVSQLKQLTTGYDMHCEVRVPEPEVYCEALRDRIFQEEDEISPIAVTLRSVVFYVAALQVFFAVVGVVATSTKNSKAARLFMVAFWMASLYELTIGIMLCPNARSDLPLVLLKVAAELIFFMALVYFYVVASLFHKKCTLEETGRLAVGVPVEIEDISLSETRTPITV